VPSFENDHVYQRRSNLIKDPVWTVFWERREKELCLIYTWGRWGCWSGCPAHWDLRICCQQDGTEKISYRKQLVINIYVQNYTLKGLSRHIRFAWKGYGSLGLGKDMWRWTFKFFLLSLYFCIVYWSSYATHTKHLPVYFFLGSRQVFLQAGLEFSFSSY
jgi:hypothetical protein